MSNKKVLMERCSNSFPEVHCLYHNGYMYGRIRPCTWQWHSIICV